MQWIKKSIATLFADCVYLQNININLFKVNIEKKNKTKEEKGEKSWCNIRECFWKSSNSNASNDCQKKAPEKEETTKAKKLAIINCKIALATKKIKIEKAKKEQSSGAQGDKTPKKRKTAYANL